MTPLSLPSGATGFTDDRGQWVCTGSQMGRRNVLPDDRKASVKLRLVRLPFVDGCYDKWGAYWGSPANVYCAFAGDATETELQGFARVPVRVMRPDVAIFTRANSHAEAKQKVRELLPNARFYN